YGLLANCIVKKDRKFNGKTTTDGGASVPFTGQFDSAGNATAGNITLHIDWTNKITGSVGDAALSADLAGLYLGAAPGALIIHQDVATANTNGAAGTPSP